MSTTTTADTDDDDIRGIVCSRCECPDLRVTRTRKVWGGKIRRWRECQNPNCGHTNITTESGAGSTPEPR